MPKYLVLSAVLLIAATVGAFIAISSSGGEASGEGASFTGFAYDSSTQTSTWTIRIEDKAYANLTVNIKASSGESVVDVVASNPPSACTPALPQTANVSCTMPANGVLTLDASSKFAQRCEAAVFSIPTVVITPPQVTPPLPPLVASGSGASLDASGKTVTNVVPGNATTCAKGLAGPGSNGQSQLAPSGNTNIGPIKRGRPAN